jgi:putative two-component system response regulator
MTVTMSEKVIESKTSAVPPLGIGLPMDDQPRILIIDDQIVNIRYLQMLFAQQGSYEIEFSCDPRDTFELLESFQPDILLIDRNMPHVDGLELLERLGRLYPDRLKLPVIMLTADRAPETKLTALGLGASDFLHKPFDNAEVILRVSGQLERRRMHLKILNYNEELEERVRERTQELEEAQLEIV